MATRPKSVIESQDGEKLSPITIAKNVLTDDGQNLQDILSDRKEDMMTPTIENSSSMSKVGQGDNVDYSDNVVNGAYEDVVLKGKSLVNVDSYYSKDDFFMQNIDTISTDGYIRLTASGSWKNSFTKFNGMLKPNTKYLAIVDIKTNTLASGTRPFRMFTNGTNSDGTVVNVPFVDQEKGIECGVTGTFKYILTTRGDLSTCVTNSRNYVSNTVPSGVIEYRYVLIEYVDGMENWEIPFFRGICDCKSPILSNVGKNLINALNCSTKIGAIILSKEQNCITFKAPNAWAGLLYHLNLKPNTTYTFSFERDSVDTKGYVRYKTGMSDWSGGHGGSNKYTFTTDGLGAVMFTIESATVRDSVTVKNIMIEETTTKNLYEPHKLNTTTFDQKDDKTIVLRSLPNGVCDTLNVKTGEYVQRIGEIVLDGVNYKCIKITTNRDETKRFDINFTFEKFVGANSWIDLTKMNASVICDKAICISNGHSVHPNKNAIASFNGILVLFIEDNTILTIEKANEWLQQNPITVQYELATPIVKQVNVEGYPYAYENGHVLLESGSQEQSLTPTIEYSIVANRGGQIRSNQKMVERHQKQLDRLQAMILTNLVNTQYEQALTNLKYDLKNVREEVK